ncbi:hypothetical protein [Streptomyces sp. NPDC003719]
MRVMLKATLDTERANELVRSGRMSDVMRETLEHIKPEAAYFGALDGRRTALLFFDMQDSSELPALNERFFTEMSAEVEVCPIMNGDDLAKGLSQMR